jgi:hypothetical protein
MFWAGLLVLAVSSGALVIALWRRGYTIEELVRRPPEQVDLPEVVNILSYLHHELIKHRMPLVRTVAETPLEDLDDADLAMMREAVTGTGGRASLVDELEGYLTGLRRAAGSTHLNYRRDPLVRRARKACRLIQSVADGLADGERLSARQHRGLQWADETLGEWFRTRVVALRGSVLSLEVTSEIFEEPVARVMRELGVGKAACELPELREPVRVRMLHPDFNLVVRNLVRNGMQRSERATGEPRVAVDVATRMELSGDESVLISVHDTDPTMLSREDLYGGALGRGLSIVTTTLRRYDGALRCVESVREGFAKCLEIRLFLADADSEALVLRGGSLSGWGVPAISGAAMVAVAVVCVLGWSGTIPDPLVSLGLSRGGPLEPDPFAVQTARKRASLVVFDGVTAADDDATREAFVRRPDLARGRVPGPLAIHVDRSRCAPPQRIVSERRLEVDCHLLKPDLRLGNPVLSFRVDGDYDPTGLEHVVRELVIEGDTTRTLEPNDSCIQVTPVAIGDVLPPAVAARTPGKRPQVASSGRLVVDYSRCLLVPRYPLRVQIRLQRPKGSPRAPSDDARYQPMSLDVRVRLRRLEDAHDAYARIHNDRSVIADRENRHALSQVIARRVTADFEGSWAPEALPGDLQKHVARAAYFGWVWSPLFRGLEARIDGEASGVGPTKEVCALMADVEEGWQRIAKLDSKAVREDLYRSQYYGLHARLWIGGSVVAAIRDFDEFQLSAARQTDFVQGARLYLATLLSLGKAPDPDDVEGTDPDGRLVRIAKVLSDMKKDAKKPPRRGKDRLYDRVKLMGIERVLDGEGDEGFSVNDVLCGWRRARPRWSKAIDGDTQSRIFAHCPSHVPPGPALDPDAGIDPDAGVPEAPPLPPPTPATERAQRYLVEFTGLMRGSTWRCGAEVP